MISVVRVYDEDDNLLHEFNCDTEKLVDFEGDKINELNATISQYVMDNHVEGEDEDGYVWCPF